MQSQQQRKNRIIQIARATQATIDASWIPEHLQGNRYFSREDLWIYIPHYDQKLCEECAEYAFGVPFISGRQIRRSFPNMQIIDENTIEVYVHPNCRCELIREGTESPKDVLSKEEARKAFTQGLEEL